MEKLISRTSRRLAVVINYGAILLFLVCFYLSDSVGWNVPIAASVVTAILVALITFFSLHVRTKLWKLVHSKIDKLDERELQVTHEALRYAYGIFTVVSLLVLLAIALSTPQWDSLLILIFASLLYLAHTLPSSVIAWRKKDH
ncbi:MAG: hypothetical protein KAT79_05210 [candidate division Zixibacteria bacterium]|nr:hypothetical protein [candidate division Zixibacteria bacterium]